MNDQKTKLPPLPAHTISGPAGTGDYFNGHTDAAMTEFGQACYAAALADQAGEQTHDPLPDFQEGQWWIRELDEASTCSQNLEFKRAVAVVHNLLRAVAAQAGEQKPVSVEVKRNRVWIVSGVQSFMLAYEADTDGELQWYAAQLRTAMSGITPDVKAGEQKPAMSDLVAHHQTPKAKAMAELTQGEQKPVALTEAEILEALAGITNEVPQRLPPGWLKFARGIEAKCRPQPADERLREAAQAVVERWDSIDWKSAPTADFIARLRDALRGAA